MPPQSLSAPCPWPQAQQGTLLCGTSPRDAMAAGYGEGGYVDQERSVASPAGADGDTAGESLRISPSFKHFFSKLKQSTSEAITVSLETNQCKNIPTNGSRHPCALSLPPSQICQQNLPAYVHLRCSFLFALYCSSSLFSPHHRQTHFHQKVDSFLHSKTCTSPSICLVPHLSDEDFSSNIHWEVREVAAPKGSAKCCPAFHSAHLLL